MTTLQRPIIPRNDSSSLDALPTFCGLTPIQLHDYYWAARGVQVVRLGESSTVLEAPELFLLTDEQTLVLFRTRQLVDILSWVDPTVLIGRVHETRHKDFQEFAETDACGKFQRFLRVYAHEYTVVSRIAFTTDPDIARAWQAMNDTPHPWRRMRRHIPNARRETTSLRGRIYGRFSHAELHRFSQDLVQLWTMPSTVITRVISHRKSKVWLDQDAKVANGAHFVGNVWVGAGRQLSDADLVAGPAILWDNPLSRPKVETIEWHNVEPSQTTPGPRTIPRRSSLSRIIKRGFDFLFSLAVILITLPIYPLVMLAILIEDGRPFWFFHQRETTGGREFPCLKFRSMRKDAEQIKATLSDKNQADGPQFYMEKDPRLTKVGRFIRKTNIDELPQFFNVLMGHMSVVGPRPSPRRENQFSPAWREARLSVRPGVTGLWQVNRTRIRGADFQEWIKYDIEYVENQSWRLDLKIIWKTIIVLIKGFRNI